MRILMLGWEFPPFITGGLGTACHGLTKALDHLGHDVVFVLPKSVDNGDTHVRMLSPTTLSKGVPNALHDQPLPFAPDGLPIDQASCATTRPGFSNTKFLEIEAPFSSPYGQLGPMHQSLSTLPHEVFGPESLHSKGGFESLWLTGMDKDEEEAIESVQSEGAYGRDLIGDSNRYARMVVALARREAFDVIHAHDWLTYPAGLALRAVSGKPLVVHVHATEFDRSGDNVNQSVYDIERAGMAGADRIIAVSMLTKGICVSRHGADPEKIDVVYNGVDRDIAQPAEGARIDPMDKVVLFLGRITMQKGPEYFIQAARRVLEKVDNVKFVVAGSGDMALGMIEMAASLGIGHKVLFTGFLHKRDVERIFDRADCYVMPSVSEPFGIAPLEAMLHNTPVIISKQSGAAEVLSHALKVDFWDVDDIANKIVSVIRHGALSKTLREHGSLELRRLTWEGAAERCTKVYHRAAVARAVI